ncbi:hypothetical protein CPS_4409 [Colwellia psychrerythraea 34H]|uniref:Uncharacterized protein n=1 Tax=Colwellia psychrerythraea (strain 34H / ATCC BAA-681) TaxID=167879 RepID=Q47VW4_COLP3|nr:hypothetical protein CPS_4409 [Colwellia psychrerythraea 34H]
MFCYYSCSHYLVGKIMDIATVISIKTVKKTRTLPEGIHSRFISFKLIAI